MEEQTSDRFQMRVLCRPWTQLLRTLVKPDVIFASLLLSLAADPENSLTASHLAERQCTSTVCACVEVKVKFGKRLDGFRMQRSRDETA